MVTPAAFLLRASAAYPLGGMVAAVSEGICPRCRTRLSPTVPFDYDEYENDHLGPREGAFAQGGCQGCGAWLRAGTGPNGDWIEITSVLDQGDLAGCLQTITINPPEEE